MWSYASLTSMNDVGMFHQIGKHSHTPTTQARSWTDSNSGLHREFCRDLIASSGSESFYQQCPLTIGCHLDWTASTFVFRGITASVLDALATITRPSSRSSMTSASTKTMFLPERNT